MKSNKERARIILSKCEKQHQEQNYQTSTVQAEKKSKNFWKNKKAWISVCTAFVMVLTLGLGLGLGLSGNGNAGDYLNLNNMYIANFEQYTAIGSGALGGVDTATGANVSIQATYKKSKHKLVGVRRDGVVEEVKVTDGKDDAQEIKWGVCNMSSLKNFTIVSFSKYSHTHTRFYMDDSTIIVIIDNRTGKIYSLESLLDNTKNQFYLYVDGQFDIYPTSDIDRCESDDSLYFKTEQSSTHYYKATVKDGELEIKEIFDSSNMVAFNRMFVDKYGNIFLGNTSVYSTILYANYCITTNGQLIQLNSLGVCRALNGIVYTSDKSNQFDEAGNIVDNTFENADFYRSRVDLVKRVGNIEYYFSHKIDSTGNNAKNIIYKVTWKDEIEFDVEETVLTEYTKDYVVTADKIYFRSETKIFSVDIETGLKTDLTSDYFFTSIETDNLGNVVFTGLDKNMNTVSGLIRNDGTIEKNVTASEYEVYYIKALN